MADDVLRDYALVDITRIQQASANPFTARVSTSGKYAELDTFSDWTIQDWHSGVGNSDPEAGPLFSMAETRFPGYLMPPPGWEFPFTVQTPAAPLNPAGSPASLTLLSDRQYSVSFTAPQTGDIEGIWVYVHCPSAYSLDITFREDDGTGKPGAEVDSAGADSIQTRVHGHWMKAGFASGISVTSGTRYHICITSNVDATLGSGIAPYAMTTVLSGGEKCYRGTIGGSPTWTLEPTASGTVGFFYYMTYSDITEHPVNDMFIYDGDLFLWMGDEIYKMVAGALVSQVSGITIYDVIQIENLLYVAYGTGYKIYDMEADSTSDKTADAYQFLLHGGYLWRSLGVTISYTADETTWTDLPNILGASGNYITGMAGLEREVYFATQDGLFVAVEGDEILQVAPWPEVHPDNGKGMISWEGALYIPLYGGTIMRYDPSGAMINVGINAKEELPLDLRGTVRYLKPTNYFLMAVVESWYNDRYSSLWSYNVDGWHCLGLAPAGVGGGAICLDRENEHLYWGMNRCTIMRTSAPGNINNPVRVLDDLALAPEGWVEYDRFYGPNHTLDKDFDRIYIDTERAGQNVHVYWQDDDNYADYEDGHDGEMGWQYLGTVAAGESAIQFPAAARPGGKSFRLALRITGSPVVRGLSLKYSTNVADRWRWVLPIAVHDDQQFPDGSLNLYSAAEMLAHLDSLKNDTAPLQYQDIDGTTYYVKVTAASRQVARYEWLPGSDSPDIQYVYVLNIEEVS